jgi:hypothetical protein
VPLKCEGETRDQFVRAEVKFAHVRVPIDVVLGDMPAYDATVITTDTAPHKVDAFAASEHTRACSRLIHRLIQCVAPVRLVKQRSQTATDGRCKVDLPRLVSEHNGRTVEINGPNTDLIDLDGS